MFTITKGVPIPKSVRPPMPVRRKYPFEQMEVGDMFFVPEKARNTITAHTSDVGRRLGRKFTTRLTTMRESLAGWTPCAPDEPGAVQGIGVWRTE